MASPGTVRLTRDNGNALCDRIEAQDSKECEDDIQPASTMADDTRDTIVDYQVGGYNVHMAAVSPSRAAATVPVEPNIDTEIAKGTSEARGRPSERYRVVGQELQQVSSLLVERARRHRKVHNRPDSQ